MARKITQRDRVVQYVNDFGSISSWEAYEQLGITQLGARIFELEQMGFRFKRERVAKKNRYGDDVKFVRYRLVEKESI